MTKAEEKQYLEETCWVYNFDTKQWVEKKRDIHKRNNKLKVRNYV